MQRVSVALAVACVCVMSAACSSDEVDDRTFDYCFSFGACEGSSSAEETDIREGCIDSQQAQDEEASELGCAAERDRAFACRARNSRCDFSTGSGFFILDDDDDLFGCGADFDSLDACLAGR